MLLHISYNIKYIYILRSPQITHSSLSVPFLPQFAHLADSPRLPNYFAEFSMTQFAGEMNVGASERNFKSAISPHQHGPRRSAAMRLRFMRRASACVWETFPREVVHIPQILAPIGSHLYSGVMASPDKPTALSRRLTRPSDSLWEGAALYHPHDTLYCTYKFPLQL